jgi:hypothetical protein
MNGMERTSGWTSDTMLVAPNCEAGGFSSKLPVVRSQVAEWPDNTCRTSRVSLHRVQSGNPTSHAPCSSLLRPCFKRRCEPRHCEPAHDALNPPMVVIIS